MIAGNDSMLFQRIKKKEKGERKRNKKRKKKTISNVNLQVVGLWSDPQGHLVQEVKKNLLH